MRDNELVLILGRRCGTSTMAQGLLDRGFPLRGPLDKRHFPSNVQGHFECLEARELNFEIMRHFRITCEHPALVPFLVWPRVAEWIDLHPPSFVIKEPNLNFTWPIWSRSTKRSIRVIWCRRDPAEQEASLVKWYDKDPEQAAWTVKQYEQCSRAASIHFECLQVWLDDPERIDKVVEYLNT